MTPAVKGALKSKTNWLALALIVLGYFETKQALLLQYVPPHWQGLATMALGATLTVVRFFTSQSLTDKGLPKPDDTDDAAA
jgi:hypothetical protein